MAIARSGWLLALGMVGLLVGCSHSVQDVNTSSMANQDQPAPEDVEQAPTPRIMPQTHYAAGRMLETKGDLQGAITQYERAIASEPRFANGYNALSIAYQKMNRFEEAENVLRQGLRAQPNSALLSNTLGWVFLMTGRFSESESAFRTALALNTEFKEARGNLAIVLARTGKTDESVREFSRVVPSATAHCNVGLICAELRDYAKAERYLSEALKLNPHCPGAAERLAALPTRGPVYAKGDAPTRSVTVVTHESTAKQSSTAKDNSLAKGDPTAEDGLVAKGDSTGRDGSIAEVVPISISNTTVNHMETVAVLPVTVAEPKSTVAGNAAQDANDPP